MDIIPGSQTNPPCRIYASRDDLDKYYSQRIASPRRPRVLEVSSVVFPPGAEWQSVWEFTCVLLEEESKTMQALLARNVQEAMGGIDLKGRTVKLDEFEVAESVLESGSKCRGGPFLLIKEMTVSVAPDSEDVFEAADAFLHPKRPKAENFDYDDVCPPVTAGELAGIDQSAAHT